MKYYERNFIIWSTQVASGKRVTITGFAKFLLEWQFLTRPSDNSPRAAKSPAPARGPACVLPASVTCSGQGRASVCPQSSQPQTVPREGVSHVSSEPQAHIRGPPGCVQTHLYTHTFRGPIPAPAKTYAQTRTCLRHTGRKHTPTSAWQGGTGPGDGPPARCLSSERLSESLMRPCVFGILFKHCHFLAV